jgi:hypothetical protein
VLYYVGIYLLFYLSRTREYLADAFSAERIEARHLASALVKIAYGIVKVEDTEATQSLLQSTRHMGHRRKNARHVGRCREPRRQPGLAAQAMFDRYNSGHASRAQPTLRHRHAHLAPRRHRQTGRSSPTTTSTRASGTPRRRRSVDPEELALLARRRGAAVDFPACRSPFAAAIAGLLTARYPSIRRRA